MKSPLQLYREWRCDYRHWARQGLMPNQLRMSESVLDRHCQRIEAAQYRPCVKCGCPRYYHPSPPVGWDHFWTDGPLELLDADRR